MTTACTCEYNLTIEDGKFKENIKLTMQTDTEIKAINNKWTIPIDKEEYDIGLDTATDYKPKGKVYDYTVDENTLTLKNDFTIYDYNYATAPSLCYNKVTVNNSDGNTIISTSPKAECFDKYPSLTRVNVKITVDGKVISNNADSVSGNTYIWNLTKANASNKAINMILEGSNSSQNNNSASQKSKKQNDDSFVEKYARYIFCGALLIIFLLAYAIYKKITKDDESIDK